MIEYQRGLQTLRLSLSTENPFLQDVKPADKAQHRNLLEISHIVCPSILPSYQSFNWEQQFITKS